MLRPLVSRCLGASLLLAPALALSACPRVASVPEDPLLEAICEDASGWGGLGLRVGVAVDILFVIDNSGSMAEHQVKLEAGIAELFARLDAVDADYRIGFTTTDNGNPWCPVGTTTPEAGKLVLSSCEQRLDDFVFDGGAIDARDVACSDPCTLDPADLVITPTSTDVDPNLVARPWIERRAGVTNLPAGTDPVEAFKCFAPQGINGCGFESPLESMLQGLARAQDVDEVSYGFLRQDAVLAVVILTDEVDCSYNQEWAAIFEQDGDKVFWEDPSEPFPSSALCWNAGVTCIGSSSGYDGCEPVNKDELGNETANPSRAVLHSVSRYTARLAAIETQLHDYHPDLDVLFTLIAGVEGGGEDWTVTYADAEDPAWQLAFGIGPGCTGADGLSATPPVRLRSVAETVDPLGLYSVCAADYGQAMASLGDRISTGAEPSCHWSCVADGDRSTPQLEPRCTVRQLGAAGASGAEIVDCEREPDGRYRIDPATGGQQIPAGQDLCYALLVDPGGETLDTLDNLSDECVAAGSNLEFVLVRRLGYSGPSTSIEVDCELSGCPELDCAS